MGIREHCWTTQYLDILSVPFVIKESLKNNGAWLVDLTKEANFAQLNPNEVIIDNQLNETFAQDFDINFNGNNLGTIINNLSDDLLNF